MIDSSMLKDLLLITNPKVLGLSNYLNQSALLFLLPAFYIGMIVEYFTNFDFKSVAKRAVIAFLAIKLLMPIHVEVVDTSLKVSSELISRYSPQNKFLMAYQNAKGESVNGAIGVKTGVWSKLTSIVEMVVDDPIVMIIFLLSYVAFFLLTQIYSLTYHLAIALFGLCAVLSILPITSKSLTGAVKTSLWCIIMPFVVAIVLALIGDSDAFFKTYSGGIVQNLESLIQLLVMTIILLLTPMITSKIMNDSGVSGVAENIGQMAAMSAMFGGASIASKFVGSNSKMIGGTVLSNTSKPLMNKIKGSFSKRASEISQSKGIGPTLNTLTSNGGDKFRNGLTDFKDGMKKTSLPEKIVLGADAMMNRKENSLAKLGRSQEAQKLKNYQDKKMSEDKSYTAKASPFANRSVLPLGDYKKEAREYMAQRNSQRSSYGNMKRKNPEASNFLKNRTPHVLNPIPQHQDKNGGLVLERKKMKPRERVLSKRPFMHIPNLKPSFEV